MKTLGDTGLIPDIRITQQHDDFDNGFESGENHMIDKISALPILAVVKKAVEMGAVKFKACDGAYFDDSNNIKCIDFEIKKQCPTCSGTGFTITEGE